MKFLVITTIALLPLAGYRWQMARQQQVANNPERIIISCIIPAVDSGRLEGRWFLLPVLSSDTATGRVPTLVFDTKRGRFTGNTGCNSMNGRFSSFGKNLQIDSNIVTTKMACPGYNERAFIKNLLRANGYRFDDGVLVLLFDGTELSRWVRNLAKPRSYRA
jgi:heat shock protein HslJ